jgi:hypothetical protein
MGHANPAVPQVFYRFGIVDIPILLLSLCDTIYSFSRLFSVGGGLAVEKYTVLSRAAARAFSCTEAALPLNPGISTIAEGVTYIGMITE